MCTPHINLAMHCLWQLLMTLFMQGRDSWLFTRPFTSSPQTSNLLREIPHSVVKGTIPGTVTRTGGRRDYSVILSYWHKRPFQRPLWLSFGQLPTCSLVQLSALRNLWREEGKKEFRVGGGREKGEVRVRGRESLTITKAMRRGHRTLRPGSQSHMPAGSYAMCAYVLWSLCSLGLSLYSISSCFQVKSANKFSRAKPTEGRFNCKAPICSVCSAFLSLPSSCKGPEAHSV